MKIFDIINEADAPKIIRGGIPDVDVNSFNKEVLTSEVPVLVDYWAEWCAPCRMIGQLLGEIAGRYANKLKIVKIDIDDNPQFPSKYGFTSIPTLMLFKDGAVEGTTTGAISKSKLTSFLDSKIS